MSNVSMMPSLSIEDPAGSVGLIGLKIEISPTIELVEKDRYFGRKQVIIIPQYCRTVYEVKEYVKSLIHLPQNIHFSFGDFCLRDDQNVAIFTCFKEPVLVREVESLKLGNSLQQLRISDTGITGINLLLNTSSTSQSHHQLAPINSTNDSIDGCSSSFGFNDLNRNDISVRKRKRGKRAAQSHPFDIGHITIDNGGEASAETLNPAENLVSSPDKSTVSERLSKSAKRRLRKQRIMDVRTQQSQNGTDSASVVETGTEEVRATKRAKKHKRDRTEEEEELVSSKNEEPKTILITSDPSVEVTITPVVGSSTTKSPIAPNQPISTPDEFLKPKPKKPKCVTIAVDTPEQEELSEDSSSSSSAGKKEKLRPDTPFLPKVIKNPLIFGFNEKLDLSNSSNTEEFGANKIKPDTPNLPMISKSPHYNYVNKGTLGRLSRDLALSLERAAHDDASGSINNGSNIIVDESRNVADSTIELAQNESVMKRKREEAVERMNKTLSESGKKFKNNNVANVSNEEIPIEEKGANGLEDREAYFDSLSNVDSIEEVQEGNIIAFKTTELDEHNCPIISPYKEALVKLKQGPIVQLEYLNVDLTKPVQFEIEGYSSLSTNNPELLNFDYMISPKHVPRSPI